MNLHRPSLLRGFVLAILAPAALAGGAQPADKGPILPLDEVKAGQHGEVWTVFRGTEPEPFSVEVTGVVRNALGPGKSVILCQMTDPRVKDMGAAAGMSGSPLYIDGRFAGALSYQLQTFETTPYAGFTPAADMTEVAGKVRPEADSGPAPGPGVALADGLKALRPVFGFSGLSPAVAELMRPYFSRLGLEVASLGGSDTGAAQPGTSAPPPPLRPGAAVSVALATGDITLAGTGTVSRIEGDRVIAFGHPMTSMGSVELPLCSAEIVTIIPSALTSIKVANTGPVIGTITQDRLSAVSGLLGPGPGMIDVEISVLSPHGPPRTLRFQAVRHDQLTPVIVATGVTQVINGSNEYGLSNGFRLDGSLRFSAAQSLDVRTLYSGPQAFAESLADFIRGLSQDIQNPYEKTYPRRIAFTVEPLDENPAVTIDLFRLSQSTARAGDVVHATLEWRDYQGAAHRDTLDIPVDPAWSGKSLEVIAAPGRALDIMTGRPRSILASQLRSFDAYLSAMGNERPDDGISVAVVEPSSLFLDQTDATADLPGSMARIATSADEARFQRMRAVVPLWERRLLPGKLVNVVVRRALRVDE